LPIQKPGAPDDVLVLGAAGQDLAADHQERGRVRKSTGAEMNDACLRMTRIPEGSDLILNQVFIGRPEAEKIGVRSTQFLGSPCGGMSFFIEHPESRARWRLGFFIVRNWGFKTEALNERKLRACGTPLEPRSKFF
jgi:hypothetical protein